MIGGHGVGNRLQQHRFAGTWGSDDQPALAFTHRGQQIHDPPAGIFVNRLHLDPFLGIKRGQIVKKDLVPGLFGRLKVDSLDFHQGKIFLPFVGRTHIATDGVTGL